MSMVWAPFSPIRRDLDHVATLIRAVADHRNPRIRDGLRAVTEQPGKMLRPGFVVLAARIAAAGAQSAVLRRQRHPSSAQTGGRELPAASGRRVQPRVDASRAAGAAEVYPGSLPARIYQIAAAVELLHIATLIHDDVIDDAAVRRGRPTLHRLVSAREAVLIGDYLLSTCFSMVAEYAGIDSAKLLAAGVGLICEGEIDQSMAADSGFAAPSVRRYLRRIAGKTALLFGMALQVGAWENGADTAVLAALRRVGYAAGIGFQIVDDVLDFAADPDQLGKPIGADLRNGVVTLPVILALQSEPPERRSARMEWLRNAPIESVVEYLNTSRGIEYAMGYVGRYTGRAMDQLSGLPAGEARETLAQVLRSLLARRR